jgi:guanyl-specific ribonuclease Sa
MCISLINKVPLQDRDQVRTIKSNITQGKLGGKEYMNKGGHGSQLLKVVRRGQEYREYQLGAAKKGGAGNHRLVVLIDSDGQTILRIYYTTDHYATFKEVR